MRRSLFFAIVLALSAVAAAPEPARAQAPCWQCKFDGPTHWCGSGDVATWCLIQCGAGGCTCYYEGFCYITSREQLRPNGRALRSAAVLASAKTPARETTCGGSLIAIRYTERERVVAKERTRSIQV